MKPAVIIIDMVNDFVTGKFKNPRAEKMIPNVRQLIEMAHQQNIPVIYCSDEHLSGDNELAIWGNHCMKGTWGAQIIPELTFQDKEYALKKRTYSAFFETELDHLLQQLNVDTLVLAGVVTDICVKHTAADGFFNGYKIVVPKETTEAIDEESYLRALDEMKQMYHATIVSLADLM